MLARPVELPAAQTVTHDPVLPSSSAFPEILWIQEPVGGASVRLFELLSKILDVFRRPVGYLHPEVHAHLRHPFLYLFRSEEHTSDLQSLMRISSSFFCFKYLFLFFFLFFFFFLSFFLF